MAVAVIEADDLHRTYRTTTGAFRRRSKDVEGELFGLLGPNGAGKTTTIKMLITLLIPTSGSARVLGYDVVKDAREVRKRIGYVFGGDRGVYERLSGYDNLRYFAELYGVPARDQKRRIAELLDLVGLAGREKERVEGYRAACASGCTSRAASSTTRRASRRRSSSSRSTTGAR